MIVAFSDVSEKIYKTAQETALYLSGSKPVKLYTLWTNINLTRESHSEIIQLFRFRFLNKTELQPPMFFLKYYECHQTFVNDTSCNLNLNPTVPLLNTYI